MGNYNDANSDMAKEMSEVKVKLDNNSYSIIIGNKILAGFAKALKQRLFLGNRLVIVTNPTVRRLNWFNPLCKRLGRAGYKVGVVSVPPEATHRREPDLEKFKSNRMAMYLYGEFLKNRLDRTSTVVAVGGGTTGDLASFAASTYMRGINLIHIPTTLLAQVDSSVGGKTAINLPQGKNLVGTFYQPRMVYIDIDTLKSLPRREIRCGFAEIVKYGVIKDGSFFNYLEENIEAIQDIIKSRNWSRHTHFLLKVITRCCQIKAWVVKKDEQERRGLREILNYGHTIGHGIEAAGRYTRFHHGEAISIGMLAASRLAYMIGMIAEQDLIRQRRLVKAIGLPTTAGSLSVARITKAMMLDKKFRGNKLRFVLPKGIGSVVISDEIRFDLIAKALKFQLKI